MSKITKSEQLQMGCSDEIEDYTEQALSKDELHELLNGPMDNKRVKSISEKYKAGVKWKGGSLIDDAAEYKRTGQLGKPYNYKELTTDGMSADMRYVSDETKRLIKEHKRLFYTRG